MEYLGPPDDPHAHSTFSTPIIFIFACLFYQKFFWANKLSHSNSISFNCLTLEKILKQKLEEILLQRKKKPHTPTHARNKRKQCTEIPSEIEEAVY